MFRRLLNETSLSLNKSQKRNSSTNQKICQILNIPPLNKNINFFNSQIDDDASTARSSSHHLSKLIPDEKEISILKKELNYFFEDVNKYFIEIENFMKNLDKVNLYIRNTFIENMPYNETINFVNSFYDGKKSLEDILKFRQIYSFIISEKENEKNNKILTKIYNRQKEIQKKNFIFENFGEYSRFQKNICDLIGFNSIKTWSIENKDQLSIGINKILKNILDLFLKCELINKAISEFDLYENKTYYPKRVSFANNNIDDNKTNCNNCKNQTGKIIEKKIDFKIYQERLRKNNSVSNSLDYRNSKRKSILRNKKDSMLNTSLQSSLTSVSNDVTNFSREYSNNTNNTQNILINYNPNDQKDSMDLVLNSSKIISGKTCMAKSNSSINLNINNNLLNNNFSKISSNSKNIQINTEQNINLTNNYNIKNNQTKKNNYNNLIQNQSLKPARTYIHKKLATKENIARQKNEKHIINNDLKSSIYQVMNNIKSSILATSKDEETKNNYSDIENNNTIYEMVKIPFDKKIIINHNFPLYVGLDLNDEECKLSLFNQENNSIELIALQKNSYSIPTKIFYYEENENIEIGEEAENLGEKNPSQKIFNILRLTGINYSNIIGKKHLWPFNLNKDNDKIYLKIKQSNQNEKKIYFQDVLKAYLEKLFEILFKKITLVSKDLNNNIKLKLIVSIPNYLNYFQKKIIEKIFTSQLFPTSSENINSKLYSGYNIILDNIKIENSANIPNFYLNQEISPKNKKFCTILIEGGSVNISIISKKRNNYEVLNTNSASIGQEDFIDNFVCESLKKIDEKKNNIILNSPILLSKLRTICINAMKSFCITSYYKSEIKISDDEIIKLELRENDYDKANNQFYEIIFTQLKQIFREIKLNIKDIDDISLIGDITKSKKIKTLIFDFFINNENISKNLFKQSSLKDKDYAVCASCSLQAINTNIFEPKYFYNDISNSSFGIETVEGKMDFIIFKRCILPIKLNKIVRIPVKNENAQINIFEGEDFLVKNNKLISSIDIVKNGKKIDNGKNYIELNVQLEINQNGNLKCYYSLDPKAQKFKYECLINVDLVRNS